MLILKNLDNNIIEQSVRNGYIKVNSITKSCNKKVHDYTRLKKTKDFLKELSTVRKIPLKDLIRTVKGGNPWAQGTWMHPDVAVNLSYWASPKYSVFISKCVNEWRYKKANNMYPTHIKKCIKNINNIPKGYFSITKEVYSRLFSKMEDDGILIPKEIMPDISVGKRFSNILKKRGVDVSKLPTYRHMFMDKRPDIEARLYPNKYLNYFLEYFENTWLKFIAKGYFKYRLPEAVEYITTFKK